MSHDSAWVGDRNTKQEPDVLIVGAGMAGLAAACELARSGMSVSILEGRDRIGGRVLTHWDPAFHAPIELGAEFIHGKPREIWDLLHKAGVKITEIDGASWCASDSALSQCEDWEQVDSILDQMDDSQPDESFSAFLEHRLDPPRNDAERKIRQRALSYVSGFNAADPSLIGVHWLVKEMHSEEQAEGERAFRAQNGYDDLLNIFRKQLAEYSVPVHTETIVDSVKWRSGNVAVSASQQGSPAKFEARQILITLPVSVLQTPPGSQGAVCFMPDLPPEKIEALQHLEMGKVTRVVLRFRERFWQNIRPSPGKDLSDMNFLFSQDEYFPTWWTAMPATIPLITGWAPFLSAERLSGQSREFVIERALRTLSKLLGMNFSQVEAWLEAAYFHDWQTDPFSRGAYSYGKVGANEAQQRLAAPVARTLFFAGEATDRTGNNGTVHGAIASGLRAAAEILAAASNRAG